MNRRPEPPSTMTPETRTRISKAVARAWRNPQKRAHILAGIHATHPNPSTPTTPTTPPVWRPIAWVRKDTVLRQHLALHKIREWLLRDHHATPQDFAAYDALGILPQHVHRGKHAHHEALLVLLDILTRLVEEKRLQREPPS